LVRGRGELLVRGPAVADEHAGEGRPQHTGGLVKAPAGETPAHVWRIQ
jgi:hypothetical protein